MIRIRESFDRYISISGEHFSLLKNPSVEEIKTLKEEEFNSSGVAARYGDAVIFYLRALIINKKDLYVWCGDSAPHHIVMKSLGVMYDKDVIPMALQLDKNFRIDTMSFSPEIRETIYDNQEYTINSMEGEIYYDAKLGPIVQACPGMKRLASSNTDWQLVLDR